MAKNNVPRIKTLHTSIADLADERIPLPERVRLFFQVFARKGDRTIRVSRTFLARTLLGTDDKAAVDRVKKAEASLERDGIIEVAVRPPSGRCREEFLLTYRYIDNPNGSVDSIPQHLLDGLNKFSVSYAYTRPSEWKREERKPQPEKPKGKGLNLPDLYVPRHFATHPCFLPLFTATEDARKSWHTIGGYVQPAELQLIVLACGEYFHGKKEWANGPIDNPGRIMCSMAKRVKDAFDEGSDWRDKFPKGFLSAMARVGPKMETVGTDPANLKLRDLIIGSAA